ncbi:hypothetical protein [Desulfoferula mesophila]|uniref:CBS domain-containing protein n=1 Tax=Desulfoferula mesophila TaxID=3058419 RepID=A0AAU9EMX6_9BACT|nr:hypothetical protein FAK_03960 [Desulfoferula mesophilus]
MKKWDGKQLAAAFAFLVAGLLVAWLAGSVLGLKQESVIIAIFLLPVLLYLVFTGQIENLKGPGGWEAKFRKEASQPMEKKVADQKMETEKANQIDKASVSRLFEQLEQSDPSLPFLLNIQMPAPRAVDENRDPREETHSPFDSEIMIDYLRKLEQWGELAFVVFLAPEGRPLGYVGPEVLLEHLKNNQNRAVFMNRLNQGDRTAPFLLPSLHTQFLPAQATQSQALRSMLELRMKDMLVQDSQGRILGLANREQLTGAMLLSLAQATEKP